MATKHAAVSLLARDGDIVTGGWQAPPTTLPTTPTDTRETNLIRQKTQADMLEEAALDAKGVAAVVYERHLYSRAIPALSETIDQLEELRQQPRDAWAQAQIEGLTNDLALLARRHAMGTLEGVNAELAHLARRGVTPPPEEEPAVELSRLGRLFYRKPR